MKIEQLQAYSEWTCTCGEKGRQITLEQECRTLMQRPDVDRLQLARVLSYAAGALLGRTQSTSPKQTADDRAMAMLAWEMADKARRG